MSVLSHFVRIWGMQWFGDIPPQLATAKRVAEVLYAVKPRTMPTPHVR
jgi:hypothetical protein